MNRFKLYSTLFVVSVLVAILGHLLNLRAFSDIFIFICFVASILYLLFTFEEPPKFESLKIPEVHNYYRSRQDNKNNILAIEFAFISFLFFTLLYSTQLSLSVTALILWGLSIPVTYFIILKTSRNDELNKIVDYVRFVKPDLHDSKTKQIMKSFIDLNTLDKNVLVKGSKNDNSTTALLADIYISYMSSIGNVLVAGEVEEINDL